MSFALHKVATESHGTNEGGEEANPSRKLHVDASAAQSEIVENVQPVLK